MFDETPQNTIIMDNTSVNQVQTGMPMPQPLGEKTYIEEYDAEMTSIYDGIPQNSMDSIKGVSQYPPMPQYYPPFYQYATVPNTTTMPHYGATLMYVPVSYCHQPQMPVKSDVVGYPMDAGVSSPVKVPMEAPLIFKTPRKQRVVIWNYCQFCQNNREEEGFYKSHILRDVDGKVVCPVLRAYNCPICNNGGGDKAHTKSYCPQLKSNRLPRRGSNC